MALHAAVSDLILIKRFLLRTRRDGGTESQSLVSVPNKPGLNPKSLYRTYDLKAYVLLIAIRLSDGDNRHGSQQSPWWFSKRVANAGTTLPHFIFITHSLLHILILKNILITTVTHHTAMWPANVVQKLKMGHSSTSAHCIEEPKCLSCNKDWH